MVKDHDMLHQSGLGDVRGAILEERMNTLIGDMKELKESSRQLVTLLVDQTKLQGDVQANTKELTAVSVLAQQNQKDIEAIGKHVAVVSMWGKVALAVLSVVLSFMGWAVVTVVNGVRGFDRVDNRVTALELIVQSSAVGNTFDGPAMQDPIAPAPAPAPTTSNATPTRRR